jgi:poly(A) polymerase
LIKKFIRRVLRLGSGADPEIIPHREHGISRDAISYGSRKTCEVLHQAGHEAYLVGGAVRDLLLGTQPKDFDVATSALPEEVHRLFRRSRLIGRRFRLAHVMYGSETVEVSTFRAANLAESDEADGEPGHTVDAREPGGSGRSGRSHEPARAIDRHGRQRSHEPASAVDQHGRQRSHEPASAVDQHGRVVRDNVYGTREQDAARRDFTVNALYYDPSNETILDFHRGMRDLKKKTVRMIGDPRTRHREDPVRMLRAVRLAAKYGFTIDARTRAPIRALAPLIENVPPARLFDEMAKILLSGHALAGVHRLRIEGLHHGVLPMLDVILEQPLGERFVNLALEQTDERVSAGKRVSPAFLFASLLWHEVLAAARKAEQAGIRPVPALHEAMDKVLDIQTDKLAIPRRFTAMMKEIWLLQPRLEQRSGRRPFALLEQERFRAGFDFLGLRAASGEVPQELFEWWEKFQHAAPDARAAMLIAPQAGEQRTRRRRRRRKPSGGESPGALPPD